MFPEVAIIAHRANGTGRNRQMQFAFGREQGQRRLPRSVFFKGSMHDAVPRLSSDKQRDQPTDTASNGKAHHLIKL